MGNYKRDIKLITLDTETYNGLIGSLKRIAIYDGKKVHYGYTFPEVETVLNNYNAMGYSVQVYIHNAEFDLRKIPELFDGSRVNWKKSLMINGKIATLSCENYTIHDSFKLLPMSLSKLSKGFQVEHGKLNLLDEVRNKYGSKYDVINNGEVDDNASLVNFLDKCHVDDPVFLEYLGYDVMSLYEVLEVLMDISGMNLHDFTSRVSTASLSRFIFKNGYKGKEFRTEGETKTDYEMLTFYNWVDDLDTEEFIRMSYCGGRTEVFKPRLDGGGYHYDVNSLYPYCMCMLENGLYPIGKPDYTEEPELAKHYFETWKKDKQGLGFVNCRVFIPLQHIPPLPVKMGKLTFPCGEVFGTWTYEELEYAEKECGVKILEYYAGCHFKRTFPVFKNFIETLYVLKETATEQENEPLRTFAKLIMNVGYGYTGMRRDDKTSLEPFDKLSEFDKIIFADEELGFIEVPTEVNADYIQVQVASYVTSRARLVLLKGMRDIIAKGGNVYYCDTDSIVSDIEMSKEFLHHSKLGFWDLEGTPEKGLFLRPKVYTELFPIEQEKDPTIKFKGVSRETQKDMDYDFYEHLYEELETGQKEFELVEKNKLLMRSIMYMKKEGLDADYHEYRDKKMNFNTVEKRVMNYKENYTEPHYFETLQDFETFSFKPVKKEVEFSMTQGGTP